MYTHGGGFVSGTLDAFEAPCRSIAHATGRVVVAVDYRLAPEHPYPAGLNDVYEVTKWVYENAEHIKGSTEHFAMMGDSSGGNYTTLTVEKSIQTGAFKVSHQVLIYPTTDLSHHTESMKLFRQGYLLEARNVHWYNEQYKPKEMFSSDPRISPMFLEDVSQMPPTFIMTVGYDPLRDEGLLYAQKLKSQGVDVHHYHIDTPG